METQLLTAIQDLQTSIDQQTEVLARLVALEEKRRNPSEWISAEEAAHILGLNQAPVTNKRKLDNSIERYKIRYTKTRPRKYCRKDIIELNQRVLAGRAQII